MQNTKKTLITGGTGLVGSAFPSRGGYVKISSNIDLRNEIETKNIFRKVNPENVIHCAARVGGVGYNRVSNAEFFTDNVKININVLDACKDFKIKKLVSFLSTCIFPENASYPLTEEKIYMGKPHKSNYGYAYSKRMLDVQTTVYREQYDVNFVSVIPTNIYGPNDNFNLVRGHVIPSLIHKCYLAKKRNKEFKVWGSGKALREFIFSKDIAKLTELIIDSYDDPEPVILSTSNEVSIEYLVDLIIKSLDFRGKVIFDKTKPEGLFRKPTDTKKLKNIFPNFKFTSIETGIDETIRWFIENYDKART